MSRASEYAVTLFKQTHGPLRCLAASDPCNQRMGTRPPMPSDETQTPELIEKARNNAQDHEAPEGL